MVEAVSMSAEVMPSEVRTRTQLRVLDESLARLGRGAAKLRLRVGEALDRLASTNGHGELGFSCVSAYARERCERGARWAADSRALARRLVRKDGRGLPIIRTALEQGTISWSMAELMSVHATAETEAEIVTAARGLTVRRMKEWLVPKTGGDVLEPDSCDADESVLSVEIGFGELAVVEATRFLVEALDGEWVTDERLLDAMLAEGESALLGLECARVSERRSDVDEMREQQRLRRAALLRESVAQETERAESRIQTGVPTGVVDVSVDAPLGSTPRQLDAEIRKCCAELARRDLDIGRMCRVLFEDKGWRRLGYACEGQYARERVGVSLSSLRHRCTLARRVDQLPPLAAALEAGGLGYEAAMLVGRVATVDTVEAWIERAKARTIKHLREEVAAVELRVRLGDEPSPPPGEAELEVVAALERAALGGELFEAVLAAKPPGRQISVRAGGGRLLRLRTSAEVIAHYQVLRARFERVAPRDASFIAFLGLAVWDAWLPSVRGMVGRWLNIHRRDRYRCCSPVCTRRDVTPHHLVFQSRGGGDEDENVASLCAWCHLDGIHQGRLRASPPASKITWVVGRDPIMVVDGRERHLVDTSRSS